MFKTLLDRIGEAVQRGEVVESFVRAADKIGEDVVLVGNAP